MGSIKSKKRVKKFGEVFTAEREVKAMCDLIPFEIWQNIGSTFLEPACGNGNFLVEIIKRKLEYCKTANDVEIAFASVVGIDIQQDNCDEAKERLIALVPNYANTEKIRNILDKNIICGDSLKIMEQMASRE